LDLREKATRERGTAAVRRIITTPRRERRGEASGWGGEGYHQ
jgi:hypothetical protein